MKLFISILISQSAGIIGSIFTSQSISTWYVDIIKPEWNPPSWVFGPVWITLYTLMGIALYLVWKRGDDKKKKIALVVFGVQLVLNALWSIIFFGLKNPGFAFIEIIFLLISIVVTTILFSKINKWAGILLLPYLAWVLFASVLNYAIWQLN